MVQYEKARGTLHQAGKVAVVVDEAGSTSANLVVHGRFTFY